MQESVEYYTVLRSQRAAERADVALVVCDATDGVTSQDLRIAELAMKSGCATALVLNKWDLTSGDEFDLDHERAPRRATSCACGRRSDRLGARPAATCSGCCSRRSRSRTAPATAIPTPELNRFLGDVVATRPPPQKQGHRLKLLYIAQIGVGPPRFSIQVNNRDNGHARLRVLRREPAARALRARGHPGDHRLRRAQAATPRRLTPRGGVGRVATLARPAPPARRSARRPA